MKAAKLLPVRRTRAALAVLRPCRLAFWRICPVLHVAACSYPHRPLRHRFAAVSAKRGICRSLRGAEPGHASRTIMERASRILSAVHESV